MAPTYDDPPSETDMTVLIDSTTFEARRIAGLLDRMDPSPHLCQVPGCVHLDAAHDGDPSPAMAA
ncbi:MAG TPA: hypothetical protein VNT51_11880 [Miltoncostaeaceae bacterium]|nr:hypothetical protein [Miltoncostaeaceae bacterium]